MSQMQAAFQVLHHWVVVILTVPPRCLHPPELNHMDFSIKQEGWEVCLPPYCSSGNKLAVLCAQGELLLENLFLGDQTGN